MENQNPAVRDSRDPLTGLLDRTAFRALLETERERSARSHQPFGLILFDIDRFKVVNYGYGEQHGDALLVSLAELARLPAVRSGRSRLRRARTAATPPLRCPQPPR